LESFGTFKEKKGFGVRLHKFTFKNNGFPFHRRKDKGRFIDSKYCRISPFKIECSGNIFIKKAWKNVKENIDSGILLQSLPQK